MHELNVILKTFRNSYMDSPSGNYKRGLAFVIDKANEKFAGQDDFEFIAPPFKNNTWHDIYTPTDKKYAEKIVKDFEHSVSELIEAGAQLDNTTDAVSILQKSIF